MDARASRPARALQPVDGRRRVGAHPPDRNLDWNDETVVDVGGGTGAMLSELVRRHPGLHGVLFDLPEVVAGVEPPAAVEVVSGDFLAGVPAGTPTSSRASSTGSTT